MARKDTFHCEMIELLILQKILRECMEEGMTRGDYLLPEKILQKRKAQAETPRERNYWKTMAAIAGVI